MTNVEKIEKEIIKLEPGELAQFRRWFIEFDANLWDNQFEEDVQSGKLDNLANQAILDFKKRKLLQELKPTL